MRALPRSESPIFHSDLIAASAQGLWQADHMYSKAEKMYSPLHTQHKGSRAHEDTKVNATCLMATPSVSKLAHVALLAAAVKKHDETLLGSVQMAKVVMPYVVGLDPFGLVHTALIAPLPELRDQARPFAMKAPVSEFAVSG